MISQTMQFIFNLFGTVHATKDIGKQAAGLYAIDEKVRVLSNHVDFLLQEHFSRPQQSCQVKTCEVYTSEDVRCEDREGGGKSDASSDGEEEDNGRTEEVHADVPTGDSQGNGAGEGQAGAGSGETSSGQIGTNASNSDGQGRGESS